MVDLINECVWRAASAGEDDFLVGAAVTGYFVPEDCTSPAIVDGDEFSYRAWSTDRTQHESGKGVYVFSTNTLARTTIYQSSNSNTKVAFIDPPIVAMGIPLAQDHGASSVGALDDLSDVNVPAPTDGDVLTWVDADSEWEAVASSTPGIFTDVITDAGQDLGTSTGLTWGYQAFNLNTINGPITLGASTVSMTDDTTNFIQYDFDTGLVIATIPPTGFKVGNIPLAQVSVSGGSPVSIIDSRTIYAQPLSQQLFTRVIADGAQDVNTTTGLDFGYKGFRAMSLSLGFFDVPAGIITLPDNSFGYIEWDPVNGVTYNGVGFTAGRYPIQGFVVTSGGSIAGVGDLRPTAFVA